MDTMVSRQCSIWQIWPFLSNQNHQPWLKTQENTIVSAMYQSVSSILLPFNNQPLSAAICLSIIMMVMYSEADKTKISLSTTSVHCRAIKDTTTSRSAASGHGDMPGCASTGTTREASLIIAAAHHGESWGPCPNGWSTSFGIVKDGWLDG